MGRRLPKRPADRGKEGFSDTAPGAGAGPGVRLVKGPTAALGKNERLGNRRGWPSLELRFGSRGVGYPQGDGKLPHGSNESYRKG
jgi:hypothetical protein